MKIRHYAIPSLAFALSSMMFLACDNENGNSKGEAGSPKKYLSLENMDTSVKPGDDFFLYVNGGWLKNAKIPSDKSRYGSFDQLNDEVVEEVNHIIQNAKINATSANESNVAKFYKSGMDSARINTNGMGALQPLLDDINNIKSTEELVAVASSHLTKGVGYFLGAYVSPDLKDVNLITVYLSQTGLGLPNKDYYTGQDAKSVEIQNSYKKYISTLLTAAGLSTDSTSVTADKIYAIENQLADISLRQQDMRDPNKRYNKFAVTEFSKKTPNTDWTKILPALKLNGVDTFIVSTPEYYTGLSKLLETIPLEDWKNYMKLHAVSQFAPYLADNIYTPYFDFYHKTLKGQAEPEARWKRVQKVINSAIGQQVGQLYVDKHFKPEAKEKMMEMVGNLKKAFQQRVETLDWMSNETKVKAIEKLNSFVSKIGYPDVWKKYDGLVIVEDNYIQNIMNAFEFEYNYEVAKYGKPVNKDEWFMAPNTVNAYYYPLFNEIVFPAGILKFPFFDYNADDAINYGGIGAVIGHEMTHGFDDQGAKYAADGNLYNWWTPEDLKKFEERASTLVKQYDNFMILDTIPINGTLTLGENIADLGGVSIAYQAFKMTKQGQSEELIDGFTPDQRFFMSWAQIWRVASTDEYLIQQVKTDYHSPGHARANIPLTNFEPFYKAFDIKEGNKMFRPETERCKIW